jgi:hypothetical protein
MTANKTSANAAALVFTVIVRFQKKLLNPVLHGADNAITMPQPPRRGGLHTVTT